MGVSLTRALVQLELGRRCCSGERQDESKHASGPRRRSCGGGPAGAATGRLHVSPLTSFQLRRVSSLVEPLLLLEAMELLVIH